MNSFRLEVMTPSKLFYRGEVDMVIVTTKDGDEGFMAGHVWACKLLEVSELWIQERVPARMNGALLPLPAVSLT